MRLFLCLLAVHAATANNVAQITCSPGKKFTMYNIRYECFTEGKITGIRPIGCEDDAGNKMENMETVKQGNFLYQCLQENKYTYVLQLTHCFTQSGSLMNPGEDLREDGGIYVCSQDQETGEIGLSYVVSTDCDHEGNLYKQEEVVTLGETELKCTLHDDKMQLVAQACITPEPESERIPVNKYGDNNGTRVKCERNKDNAANATLVESLERCIDENGVEHPIKTEWEANDNVYVCVKQRDNMIIRVKQCLHSIQYSTRSGQKTQLLKIPANNVKRGKDKNYYWCDEVEPVPQNGPDSTGPPGPGEGEGEPPIGPPEQKDPVFAPTTLDDDDVVCPNGKTLFDKWMEGDVRMKCCWRGGKAVVRPHVCVVNGINVNGGQIKETTKDKGAHECVKKGKLEWEIRELTDEEYEEWKRQREFELNANGNRGTGYENQIKCEEGYAAQDGRCVELNECQEETHQCTHAEHCANVPGSYACFCKPGYGRNVNTGACNEPGQSKASENCDC